MEPELISTNHLEDLEQVKSFLTQKMHEIQNYCVLAYYSVRKIKMLCLMKITNSLLYVKCT